MVQGVLLEDYGLNVPRWRSSRGGGLVAVAVVQWWRACSGGCRAVVAAGVSQLPLPIGGMSIVVALRALRCTWRARGAVVCTVVSEVLFQINYCKSQHASLV